jgi:hypothetical protein
MKSEKLNKPLKKTKMTSENNNFKSSNYRNYFKFRT